MKSSKVLGTVLDAKGKECRGQEARDAVREAYRGLGLEDLDDAKFDVVFAKQCQDHVRRMETERIQQDELDHKFSMAELEVVLKKLKTGKASGEDEILVEWVKFGARMSNALLLICNLA